MGRKELDFLVGKLHYMHLSVTLAVAHFYHLQRALAQCGVDRVCLLLEFRCKISDWRTLAD